MITVKLEGARKLVFDLNGMERKLANKVMPEIVSKAAFKIEENVKEAVSGKILKTGHFRGGTFRKSIHTLLHGNKRKAGASVGTNLIYAPVHEFGAIIRAKRVKYLKFFIPGVGWRQKKQVTIPARKPFAKSFKKSLPFIDRMISAVVDRAIK